MLLVLNRKVIVNFHAPSHIQDRYHKFKKTQHLP